MVKKYLETSKDGLYTINIDKAINDSVNEEKIKKLKPKKQDFKVYDAEVARAMELESVLDKKVAMKLLELQPKKQDFKVLLMLRLQEQWRLSQC